MEAGERFQIVWQVPQVEPAAVSDGGGSPAPVPVTAQKLLRNLTNVLDDLGPGAVIEVVAHGAGLPLVLATYPTADLLAPLMQRGVVFAACANTMRGQEVQLSDLTPGVQVVPAGIAHVIRRQHQGWSYIRG